jgi:glucokinase
MLLAGDIGGTKTLLALYDAETDGRTPVAEHEFHSASYHGLEDIVREFLAQTKRRPEYACFDVAGPVINGHARLTNLPWNLDEPQLSRDLGLRRAVLLNDLQAIAYAVPNLLPGELHPINAGTPEPHGPIAVIAPGTGLGEAYLVWGGNKYIACSSEGGHASFAPTNDRQIELWRHLAQRFGHVSFERVLSGPGIANIYDFLRHEQPALEPVAFASQLAQATDRTPLIAEAGLNDRKGNPLAAEALDIFVAVLGGESGNMALKILATGGVYLAGGIPAHVLPKLTDGRFMQEFLQKGRLSDVLKTMPVQVVTARAALLGAALYGLDLLAGKVR